MVADLRARCKTGGTGGRRLSTMEQSPRKHWTGVSQAEMVTLVQDRRWGRSGGLPSTTQFPGDSLCGTYVLSSYIPTNVHAYIGQLTYESACNNIVNTGRYQNLYRWYPQNYTRLTTSALTYLQKKRKRKSQSAKRFPTNLAGLPESSIVNQSTLGGWQVRDHNKWYE